MRLALRAVKKSPRAPPGVMAALAPAIEVDAKYTYIVHNIMYAFLIRLVLTTAYLPLDLGTGR